MKKVIILFGPPGSGKDTQAFKLNRELGLTQVRSSELLKNKFAQMDPQDPKRVEQENRFKTGELVSGDFVNKVILGEVNQLLQKDHELGLVFSGSPRTVEEVGSFISFMEERYGKENIKIFFVKVSKEESIRRNLGRKICQKNGHPLPDLPQFKDISVCRYDGSPFIKRDLDADVKLIGHRYDVYLRDTNPVLDIFRKDDYEVIELEGERSIGEVHEMILHHLSKHPKQ